MAHVLVVDDDADTREAIRWVLYEDAHEVSDASGGRIALAMLRASPHPLVVLLDLVMPEVGGLAVLRAVAGDATLRGRHVVILMTARSGPADPEVAEVLARLGASVLVKPFDIEALLAAVAAAAKRLVGA